LDDLDTDPGAIEPLGAVRFGHASRHLAPGPLGDDQARAQIHHLEQRARPELRVAADRQLTAPARVDGEPQHAATGVGRYPLALDARLVVAGVAQRAEQRALAAAPHVALVRLADQL